MAKPLTRQEHARLWAAMSFKERRRIMRAVNRGEALESRKDAKVAVGTARQQQKYWRWAWIVGPLSGLIFIPNWASVIVNGFLLGLVMGGLALWRHRRAAQAEQANLAVVSGKRHPAHRGKGRGARGKGAATASGDDDDGVGRRLRLPWSRDG